jgi:hypothetical protein
MITLDRRIAKQELCIVGAKDLLSFLVRMVMFNPNERKGGWGGESSSDGNVLIIPWHMRQSNSFTPLLN